MDSKQPERVEKKKWRSADMQTAKSVEDVMELRKQQTRRRLTYGVVSTFCLTSVYLVVWSDLTELRMGAYSGILGVAGSIIGFYLKQRQDNN